MLAIKMFNLPQGSTVAPQVDRLYDFAFYISLISFAAVIGALVYFAVRYHRRKRDPETTPYIEGHPVLEGTVIFSLFILVMVIFYWGWVDYKEMRHAPLNSLEINVTGKQWLWNFEYLNGRKMTNEITVPKGKPVKFIMTSSDVIHSFYVPAFRVKQDVVPGTYTDLWFNATETGVFQVFCAEYCGTAHSGMLAKVKVVEAEEYDRWQKTWEVEKQLGISSSPSSTLTSSVPASTPSPQTSPAKSGEEEKKGSSPVESPIERGKKLFGEKGCTACHTVDGKPLIGPSLKGVFGHEVELEGGKKVKADENYIRESITDPQAKMTKGFQPLMPAFKGSLSDEEINGLVSYIKSLGN